MLCLAKPIVCRFSLAQKSASTKKAASFEATFANNCIKFLHTLAFFCYAHFKHVKLPQPPLQQAFVQRLDFLYACVARITGTACVCVSRFGKEVKVFLLDEPLSNLDAKLRAAMRTELTKLHQNVQTTFIYVTHDQVEAMTMATRIVVMKDGLIQQVDTPQTLYDAPCNLFVAGFIGTPQMNFIKARVTVSGSDVLLVFGNNSVKLTESKAKKLIENGYEDKDIIFGIRPEDIKDEEMFISSSPDTTLEATVKVYEMLGAEVFLYFTIEDTDITVRVNPRTTARPGDTIKIALDAEKIHLFDKETEVTITN